MAADDSRSSKDDAAPELLKNAEKAVLCVADGVDLQPSQRALARVGIVANQGRASPCSRSAVGISLGAVTTDMSMPDGSGQASTLL
jgi:hypothetical protein